MLSKLDKVHSVNLIMNDSESCLHVCLLPHHWLSGVRTVASWFRRNSLDPLLTSFSVKCLMPTVDTLLIACATLRDKSGTHLVFYHSFLLKSSIELFSKNGFWSYLVFFWACWSYLVEYMMKAPVLYSNGWCIHAYVQIVLFFRFHYGTMLYQTRNMQICN
jgi:hypothetical protein